MSSNPVERNFVTRFILGLAIVCLMIIGGSAVAYLLRSFSVPYGGAIGVTVGAIVVFCLFSWWCTHYDTSFDTN